MTENLTTGFASQPSEPDLNLGIKRPLLAHKPWGRQLISPKFLSPLGAKSLSNFDPSIFLNSEAIYSNIIDKQFQDSPFFSESTSQRFNDLNLPNTNKVTKPTSNSTIIQQKLATRNLALKRNILSNNNIDINLAQPHMSLDISTLSTTDVDSTVIQTTRDSNNFAASSKNESLSATNQAV
ncbi:hypothetical protein, partial [Nostoc cycadae]|uniref:hypothetical protein n=1 Tax=Nostoc cycadae TaxID=246795 RepID=UPI001651A2BA